MRFGWTNRPVWIVVLIAASRVVVAVAYFVARFSGVDARGERGGFGASSQAELAEHASDVMLDGLAREEEPFGDLGVRQAFAEQAQHLKRALGEPADVAWTDPRHPDKPSESPQRSKVESFG